MERKKIRVFTSGSFQREAASLLFHIGHLSIRRLKFIAQCRRTFQDVQMTDMKQVKTTGCEYSDFLSFHAI